MALDEPKADEVIYSRDGVTVLGDERLQQQIRRSGGVRIDYASANWRGRGFMIALGDAAGGCC